MYKQIGLVSIIFFSLLNFALAKTPAEIQMDKLSRCEVDTMDQTTIAVSKHSSFKFKQTSKGIKGSGCLFEIDAWFFKQECNFPLADLKKFKNASENDNKIKEQFASMLELNCEMTNTATGSGIISAAESGVLSALVAPVLQYAKDCETKTGDPKACEKLKLNINKLNDNCKKNSPSKAVCEGLKKANLH